MPSPTINPARERDATNMHPYPPPLSYSTRPCLIAQLVMVRPSLFAEPFCKHALSTGPARICEGGRDLQSEAQRGE